MKKLFKVLRAICLIVVMGCIIILYSNVTVLGGEKTPSEQYVENMGTGINLGNSFDSFDRINNSEIDDETAWGNPEVTREYIDLLKKKGFNSIRIPFTAFTRMDNNYQINKTFLQRYKNVVNYALDSGMYVMINLHHDSSEWLKYWDGNILSEEYIKFIALWRQLANCFKGYDERLMFESINEVCFVDSSAPTDDEQNELVSIINQAFYDTVRSTGGKNATRMLVLPTTYTNHSLIYSQYLVDFIQNLNDKNVIATVHYYSTSLYAFTCNMGVSLFDEEYKGLTAREAVDEFYDCLEETFVENGIGVIVGEYGLFNMGYPNSLQVGEIVKFFEYINYKANSLGINTMLWDTGNIIDRNTGEFVNDIWGNIIQSSMCERSSYATGLDHIFVTDETFNHNFDVPLTLNGNSLIAIYNGTIQLVEGVDYIYIDDTVTLLGSYIARLISGEYGVKGDLRFVFSAGSDWHQYISYVGTATFESVNTPIREDDGFLAIYDTDGAPTYPAFIIPADYNGQLVRRIVSYDEEGQPVSANTWASDYMQTGAEFIAAYDLNMLCLMNWYNNAIEDGTYTLVIDFYDGTSIKYSITKGNNNISGY